MGKIPTWLYAANGEARLFELEPGEAWPDGWLDSPGAWSVENDGPGDPADAEMTDGTEGGNAEGGDPVIADAAEAQPGDPAPSDEAGVAGAEAVEGAADNAVTQAVDDLASIIASQDKVALDEFAAKQGIQLDRRKSFGKMVADYREAISR